MSLYRQEAERQSKEGSNMRVHSTYEVNAHKQYNPFNPKGAGSASVGRTSSGRSFAELLKSHFQQSIIPPATGNLEIQMAIAGGIIWGTYPSLKVQSKPEPTQEGSAS